MRALLFLTGHEIFKLRYNQTTKVWVEEFWMEEATKAKALSSHQL